MSNGIRLIVGLANPGAKYEDTRHNAGAWFVAELNKITNSTLKPEAKFQGLHVLTELYGEHCHLFVPTTFMNLSGQAVRAIMNYYKISPEQLLVVHDEIDLAVEDIRLKFKGGHGGHNGVHDIIQNIHSQDFYRLRIGVGHPGNRKNVVEYVLQAPPKSERLALDHALQNALLVIPKLIKGEFQQAMQELHTHK